MRTWAKAVVLVSLLLLHAAPCAADDKEYSALLARAEAARSSDRDKFSGLMERLSEFPAPSDSVLFDRYRLLQLYPKVIGSSPREAFSGLHELMGKSRSVEVRFRAGTLLANGYAVVADFQEALRILDEVMPVRSQVKDPEVLQAGLASAAVVYNQVGAYELGAEYAQDIVTRPLSQRNLCTALNLLLEADRGRGRLIEASMLDRALDACQGEAIFLGFTRAPSAYSLYSSGKVRHAVAYLERYLPDVEATRYPRLIGEFRAMLAQYRMEVGDVHRAEQDALKATSYLSEGGAESMASAYKVLYEVASQRGDLPLALDRFRRYAAADKAYLNDKRAKEFAYQVVRQEILQKSQQIDTLNQQNKLLQLQQQVDKQSAQNSRLVVLLMLLICGFVGYWAYKVKRVQLSLKRWAETDALTQVSNRHSFSQNSRETLTEAARDGEEVAMVMFDLDHFKSINDRFGHGTGDWVLKEVAEVCRNFCRRVDQIGRLGGEEFAFLLRGYDARSAVRLSDDCRARLASIDTVACGHSFVVTGSFGVTTTAFSGYDLTRLLSHADNALYRAKREGRNRVYLYDKPEEMLDGQVEEGVADNVVQLKADPGLRA